ncbi:MAG TPA: glycosyl hydrolase [Thermoanaerobaculia bacterium]|nr:glycosyl hydrolase [Thermoanaerobaculia bacterium]
MILSRRLAFLLALLVALSGAADLAAAPAAKKTERASRGDHGDRRLDPELWKAYRWREVGPYRGGRSAAVTGIPGDPNTYYFGGTGGGVWKTTDGGGTWKSVSDGFFGGSIGAVAVSSWDPNVIYAGGGEETVRGNVSQGTGLWKSTDAGRTWKHAGLEDSRHIPRIRIHPKNPDLVYAAVLGHLFGPNDMRGIYRSKNGGAAWERIHFVNRDAGAVDLAMDPTNPRILYASFWRVRRTPYSLESGGAGSSLWKSIDGGDSWTELTRNPGLPKGTLGISGVAVSPSNPDNVYSIVEAEDGGVFRSKDGGATWTRTNEDRSLRQRAWYYTRIYADPQDEEVVYVVNVQFHRSKDGGRTFSTIRTPHGDNHDLWIAPEDPRRMIEANDGGVNVSVDGGATWTPQNNQPTAQLYRVSTDNSFPYRILGAQQDNSAVRISSRSTGGSGIGFNDWQITAGGESGHIVADPDDAEVVYGGSYGGFVNRLDHRTQEARDVNPWPDDPMGWGAAELETRFQWNFPILFSPHDGNTLYAAGNRLFRSTNEGQSWETISPDLTRNDKSKLGPSGGPITKDNTSVEYYCTIFAVAESPLERGVIWTGSDDGLLHVTRDNGKSWKNVTPPDLPEWALLNSIEASPYDKGGLYVAATRYKLDDLKPYLYKTTDYGATWTRITNGIDPRHFTRVVRADPERRGLLFAGTEEGMYVSWDDGGRWEPLQLNLPIVPITDLTVKQGDLVAATQGRGFWVLDGLDLLRQLPADVSKGLQLFTPAPAYRITTASFDGDGPPPRGQGENPPGGAAIYYWLPDVRPGQTARIEILDQAGTVLRTFEGKADEEAARDKAEADEDKEKAEAPQDPAQKPEVGNPEKDPAKREKEKQEARKKKKEDDEETQKPTIQKGLNRFVWDLRSKQGVSFPGLIMWSGNPPQPTVLPGDYQVRLTLRDGEKADTVKTAPVRVLADPRSKVTPADLEAQSTFLLEIRDKLNEAHDAIRRIREVRAQLAGLRERLEDQDGSDDLLDAAKELDKKMTTVEEALYQTKNRSPQDPLNFPIRLNDKLNALAASAGRGDYRPTDQQVAIKNRLTAAIDAELAKLRGIWEKDLPAFNELARTKSVAAVIVPAPRLK